jgi:type I restriction enzyme S subunit
MTITMTTNGNEMRPLPPGWRLAELGDVLTFIGSGITPKGGKSVYQNHGIRFLRSQNVHPGELRLDDVAFVSPELHKKMLRTHVQDGDVLLNITGASIGRCAIIPYGFGPANVNQHVCILRLPDSILPSYLSWYLNSPDGQAWIMGTQSGVTRQGLNYGQIREMVFPIAPLLEQKRIVAEIEKQFTRLDQAVASLRRLQGGLARYKASVLKAACNGRLVPQNPNDEPAANLLARILAERRAQWQAANPGKKYKEPAGVDTAVLPDLPEGWVWATVDQLASHELNSITDGPFGSKLKTAHYTETGPRVIRLQNIGDGEFIDESAHISKEHYAFLKKHRVFAGDIVIAGLGVSLPRSCIIPNHVGPAIVKADCIRVKPHSKLVQAAYLNVALNSEPLKRFAVNIVHGIGRPRLNQQEIKSLPVPLPPPAEQQRIVAEVERRLSVVAAAERAIAASLARAGRLRQAILHQAFSGRLVAPFTPTPASLTLAANEEK